MDSQKIRDAAAKAHELARQLAEVMQASDVPEEHFDEVLEQLKFLLALETD